MPEVLVKEYRGDVVENVHYGSVAIISSTGETIAYTGDIEKQTYMRSASKPVQVLPTLVKGLHRRFNLTDEDVAMFNSSHWGSSHHIYVLNEIMKKTELFEEDMVMNPITSTSAGPLAAKLKEGGKLSPVSGSSKLQHCCSGKHLSLMLLQRELTGKPYDYEKPDSPVQKKILSYISMISQTPLYKISVGIDGCGVPVFALPMRNIAHCYAKLADPVNLPKEVQEAIEYNFSCINSYPEKINDYYTPSYYLNKNPDIMMKDGSRGIICMCIKSRKLGIVVKLADGWSDEFQGIIIANILEQIKYDDPVLIEQLKNAYSTKVINDCGIEIGHVECDFKLNIDEMYLERSLRDPLPAENDKDKDRPAYDAARIATDYSSVLDADDEESGIDDLLTKLDRDNMPNTMKGITGEDVSDLDIFDEDEDAVPPSMSAFGEDVDDPDEAEAETNDATTKVSRKSSGSSTDKEDGKSSDKSSEAVAESPEEDIEYAEDDTPEERARKRALRNKNSILGKNVVIASPSTTFIKNPMASQIKQAKILSTVENEDATTEDN